MHQRLLRHGIGCIVVYIYPTTPTSMEYLLLEVLSYYRCIMILASSPAPFPAFHLSSKLVSLPSVQYVNWDSKNWKGCKVRLVVIGLLKVMVQRSNITMISCNNLH